MTYTPSAHAAVTLAERIAAARAERAPRTQVQRTVWAREFLTVAQRDGWLDHLDGPHYTYAVELRDEGFTPDEAAERVRFSLVPSIDVMLAELWDAGWATCDPRTVGPNSVPWSEAQLRRQWEAMRRTRS